MQLQLNGRSNKSGAKREGTVLNRSNSSALGGLVTSVVSSFSDTNFLSRLSSLNEFQITLLFRTDTFEACRKLTKPLTMTMGSNADASSGRSRFVLAEATANILLTSMAHILIGNDRSGTDTHTDTESDANSEGPYRTEQWQVLAEAFAVLTLYCEERQMITCIERHRQTIREVLLSLSKQYGSQGQYQQARQVSEKALELESGTRSSLSSDGDAPETEQQKLSIAAIQNELAYFCMELQDFDVAVYHYQNALHLQRQVLEEEHPTVIVTLQSLAKLYLRCGMYEATLEMFHYILLLLQKQQLQAGNDTSNSWTAVNKQTEIATTLSSMGLVCYAIRDYSAALQYYRQALAIQYYYLQPGDGNGTTGDANNYDTQNQFEIATTLNSIGMILCEVGDDDEARDTLQASLTKHLEISRKCASINEGRTLCEDETQRRRHDSAISAVLYNLAVVYMQMGEDEVAVNLFSQSIHFKRAVYGGRACPEMATNLQRLGGIHLERGEHKVAILYLEEALRMLKHSIRSCLGIEEEPAATKKALYHQLIIVGNVHLASGNVEGMMSCMVEACRLVGSIEPVFRSGILTLDAYSLGRIHPRCAPAA